MRGFCRDDEKRRGRSTQDMSESNAHMTGANERRGERGGRAGGVSLGALVRLARPKQWAKGVFVLIGPVYGTLVNPEQGVAPGVDVSQAIWGAAGAFVAFAMASSCCYVVNDIADREVDRAHPRKRLRPIAAGEVSVSQAWVCAGVLLGLGAASVMLVPDVQARGLSVRWWLAMVLGVYVLNVMAYSARLKRVVVVDVMSLSAGFVLRVLGGCAAAAVAPSTWLLNVTFFVSMFLALGKRLGERRTLGEGAAAARGVQGVYTDELLRMGVVVTGVACLLTYAGYVQAMGERFTYGFNLLWLTMLPATYGLLRAMVLLERGRYDDPTEIGMKDRATQAAAVVFGMITLGLAVWMKR